MAITKPDWYKKPEMMGHIWSKETIDSVDALYKKYAKTTKQKALFNACINRTNQEWHYWSNITKKDIALLQFALRRIDKEDAYTLYYQISFRHGCLKSHLLRYLELRAYKFSKESFVKNYVSELGFYGMNKTDAIARCEKYIQSLASYNYGVK